MPKMSSYAMLLWVISLVVYFMRNIYLDLINLDVKPIVMFGLALSFPFYLLAKYTEEPSETNDSGKVEE